MATEKVVYEVGLKDLFTSKIKTATSETNKLNDAVKKTQTSLDGMKAQGSSGGGIASALGSAAVISGLTLFGKKVLDAGSFVEQLGVSFETMLGSKQRSDKLISDIQNFALKTPFELEDVAQGAKALLAYGIEAENLIPDLKVLGDISAGVGTDKLPQLILAFGQVKTATKLTGNELRQFTEAGVPIVSALAKHFKKADSEIVNMVHDGKVGFNDVEQALKGMTKEGGLFFNLMEKQSETTSGKISNMADAFTKLASNIFTKVKPAIDVVVEGLTGILNNINDIISGDAFSEKGKFIDAFNIDFKSLAGSKNVNEIFSAGFKPSDIKAFGESLNVENALGGAFDRISMFFDRNTQLLNEAVGTGNKSKINEYIANSEKLIKATQKSADAFDISLNESETLKALVNKNIESAKASLSKPKTAAAGTTVAGVSTPLNDVESRRATNINVTIGKLIETQEIVAQNLTESASKIADEVKKALLTMLNDVNYIAR
jgi:tape measure domain-containing protein